MKIVFRILIIMAAATIIGAAMFVVDNAASSLRSQPTTLGKRPDQGTRPDGEARSEDGGDDIERDFRLPVRAVKALAVIFVIAVTYFNAAKWFGKKKFLIS